MTKVSFATQACVVAKNGRHEYLPLICNKATAVDVVKSKSIVAVNKNARFQEMSENESCFAQIDIVHGMVSLLYNWLSTMPLRHSIQPSPSFSVIEAVQLSALTNSLSMVLNCSLTSLNTTIHAYSADLVLSLYRLATGFGSWGNNQAIQEVILGNIIESVRCVRSHIPHACETLMDCLKAVLVAPISEDIRITAAITFAEFLNCPRVFKREVTAKLEDDSSVLISTLSIAAVFSKGESQKVVLKCFAKMAAASSRLREKMAKRRCVVLAISRYLSDSSEKTRKQALNVFGEILKDPVAVAALLMGPSDNLQLIARSLGSRLDRENNSQLRCLTIKTLGRVYSAGADMDRAHLDSMMSFQQSKDKRVAKVAATAYCQMLHVPHPELCVYTSVTNLLRHQNSAIRVQALKCVEEVSPNPKISNFLLNETDILETLTRAIRNRNDYESLKALNIVRGWGRSISNQPAICRNTLFLDTIVESLITDGECRNIVFQMYAIEIVLTLLSRDANVMHFLKYPKLLPWLVIHSNQVDSAFSRREEIKRLTSSLSTAILLGTA